MFKLVLLSSAFVIAAAAPHATVVHQPSLVAHKHISYQKNIIEEPTVAHVGTVVKHVPTGVTHHSSSVVHDTKFSEPIYAHGSKKTIVATPIKKTTYHHTVAAAPVLTYATAPIAKASYIETAPALTYAAAPALTYTAAPIAKTSYVQAAPALTYATAPIAKAAYVEAAPAYPYAAPAFKNAYVEADPAWSYSAVPAAPYSSRPMVYGKHY
ncbi:pupal cuticle protein C1B-like [Toxorhynchites rutilus septentrionalis]|uniref:pupal cuticle protein C1B-like n=1 Tax=Toxorhynchites rutilus septentrionalis TaxID=329112 RepID=UPI00247982F1|nr:pupal cuticle protein C1B-like [Toxorhynchites rutilus septentrionalis]